jgi:hypothetical protein
LSGGAQGKGQDEGLGEMHVAEGRGLVVGSVGNEGERTEA